MKQCSYCKNKTSNVESSGIMLLFFLGEVESQQLLMHDPKYEEAFDRGTISTTQPQQRTICFFFAKTKNHMITKKCAKEYVDQWLYSQKKISGCDARGRSFFNSS
jgi:hypothetical protein